MISIDTTQIVTAEQQAALALEALHEATKTEYRRRIVEVCDEIAQINLSAACAAGLLTPEQLEIYQSGLIWVATMRAAWPTGTDPTDDTQWPAVPAGVPELAALF